jgi:uncharacterized protein
MTLSAIRWCRFRSGRVQGDEIVAETAVTDEAAEDDGLYFQRCRWCGTTMFNRLLCHICASTDFEVERSEGVGVVHRSTVVHRNTTAARNLSLIDLPEGFSVKCRVIGPPEAVRVGDRVQLAEAAGPAAGQEIVFRLCGGTSGAGTGAGVGAGISAGVGAGFRF